MSPAPELPRVTEAEAPKSQFLESLESRWEQNRFVCVGLDPDPAKMPKSLDAFQSGNKLFTFNRAIVRATADVAGFYKPNYAFYERFGISGIKALANTVGFIHKEFPGIPVIGDAKRADIGNTNIGSVVALLDEIGVDAITVSPYFGEDALKPFLEREDKGVIVLSRTSNPGAREFQNKEFYFTDEEMDELANGPVRSTDSRQLARLTTVRTFQGDFVELLGKEIHPEDFENRTKVPLFLDVAMRVANHWNKKGNCAVVAGATAPQELGLIRSMVGDLPILIPGLGSQGGDAPATIRNGMDSRGWGMIVNSSGGIIHASSESDYAKRAREETIKLHNTINKLRAL